MKFLKEYFVFSSSEKRGIFTFSIIIFLMILAYVIMPTVLKLKKTDFTEFDKEIEMRIALNSIKDKKTQKILQFKFNPNTISKDSLVLLGLSSKQAYNVINYRTKFKAFKTKKDFKNLYTISDSLFLLLENQLVFKKARKNQKIKKVISKEVESLPFDYKLNPNIAEVSDFVKIGLSRKQGRNILNYREKVGAFKTKEELKKLYTITENDYLKIEPYIEIGLGKPKDSLEKKFKKYKTQFLSIDINTAKVKDFEQIIGIGVKTATRIVELRERLGGFYLGEQLLEIYKIDTAVVLRNLSNFKINSHIIRKLNLNKVTFKELLKHPYISYNMTKKIMNYRDMHGDFKNVEEILTNNLIKPKQYRKIVHYLAIE